LQAKVDILRTATWFHWSILATWVCFGGRWSSGL